MESFSLILNRGVRLVLVIQKGLDNYEKIKNDILAHPGYDSITLLSDLEYPQLLEYYENATALLIPLDNTVQDQARFPHKIGEYTASARPIITSSVGEIKHYFTDGKNAYIADNYDPGSLAEKMTEILEDPDNADMVGREGRRLCEKEFEYFKVGSKMKLFMENLMKN